MRAERGGRVADDPVEVFLRDVRMSHAPFAEGTRRFLEAFRMRSAPRNGAIADGTPAGPLYAYFKTFLDQGTPPPPIAIQGLGRAFQLAPENISLRVSYAFALANDGRLDDALKLARAVAFDPHDGGQGAELLKQLEAMRERSKAPASTADNDAADD